MKTALLLLAFAALAITWSLERFFAAQLATQITAREAQSRELARMQRERQRLLGLQPSADELEKLRRAAAEAARLKTIAHVDDSPSAGSVTALPLGEWTPARDWHNRGNASPSAAIESTLWAAAGGDVAQLRKLLLLPDATREKADALLAQLPAAARRRFTSAEDLIAEFTIKSIPVGAAQLVWFNQGEDDNASACVFLQQPPPESGTAASSEPMAPATAATPIEELQSAPANATSRADAVRLASEVKAARAAHPELVPPSAPDNSKSAETYLSLHRDPDGWRLVVPVDAVTQIAKELTATPHD